MNNTFRLGIIAGNQSAAMLAQAAIQWNVSAYVLDPDPYCACANICTHLEVGDYLDFETVYRFGQKVDVLTFGVEHINLEALQLLKSEGKEIHPDPDAMTIIQDRYLQKLFYQEHTIPTPRHAFFKNRKTVLSALEQHQISIPFVQKSRRSYYNGEGVVVVRNKADLKKLLDEPTIVEAYIDIAKELVVIAARNTQESVKCFPAVEMELYPDLHMVEKMICPATTDTAIINQAEELAKEVITSFNICGILAVEIFIDTRGALWVNEVCPSPHISGHHTIESMVTTQYEQHLRAILGFPLGSTRLKLPAIMINLLGDLNWDGLKESMEIEGVKFHVYNRHEKRVSDKSGHVTIVAPTIYEAASKAQQVRKKLQ